MEQTKRGPGRPPKNNKKTESELHFLKPTHENMFHFQISNLSEELDQLGAAYYELTQKKETIIKQLGQVKDRIQKLIQNQSED